LDRIRLYRTEAIVLRRSDFGEADRLLTLYTPEWGKLRVIAKGVRKPTSRKSGHVELFTHSRLLVARGRNLDIVTQAETIHSFRPLREDLLRTGWAYYTAELLDRFVEEGVENRPLFNLFLATLGWLCEDVDLGLTVRFYELRLLTLVGYRPQLFHCVDCQAEIESGASPFFSLASGGLLCPRCGEGQREAQEISMPALKVLRYMQTNSHRLCQRLRVGRPLHAELEETMRRYIIYTLERNLKSVEFLQRLQLEMAGE
jgi:DNA repair protein RecO (recombination protein O)